MGTAMFDLSLVESYLDYVRLVSPSGRCYAGLHGSSE